MTSTTSGRRLGTARSATRARLVEAAEQLMLEEGYAAVTSRHVGDKAGLKPQLVHYYFRSMDDLFIEVFRRNAERNLSHFERAVGEDPSLRTLWRLNSDPRGARLTIEFVALANHRKAIRGEIARFAERFRTAQLDAVTQALAAAGVGPDRLPPIAALLLMTGLSQVLMLEEALGVTSGHQAAMSLVDETITRLESRSSG